MNTFQFRPANRGVLYRPPTMRLYHAQVVTSASQPGWLAGRPLSGWQPMQLTWASNGNPSTLTLKGPVGLAPGQEATVRPEDLDLLDGDMITLVQTGRSSGFADTGGIEWFRGYVVRRKIAISPDGEYLVITAHGAEARLKGRSVCGKWHKTASADDSEIQGSLTAAQATRSNVFASALPVIFNESGRPNASASSWKLADSPLSGQDRECKVFESPGREVLNNGSATVSAGWWTAYQALRSLVEYHDNYEVISPHTSWSQIRSVLGDCAIGEVNVDGMDLMEAIRAVLLPRGFGFALEPWAAANGSDEYGLARHRLVVFSMRNPPAVKFPRLVSDRRGRVSADSGIGQRSEVQHLTFLRDAAGIYNEVTVIGDQKRLQIVLEFNNDSQGRDLHPLWNTQTHALASWATNDVIDPWRWPDYGSYTFDNFSAMFNRGGSDYWQYRHVFRSFAWNEDAALTPVISQTPDLSDYGLGGSGLYIRRPRPLASSFTYDSDGQAARLHPRKVQLGIVGDDDSWIDVPAEIWNDRAGFTLATGLLAGSRGDGQWYPYAGHAQHAATYGKLHYLTLLHNALRDGGEHKLRLRLTGSVECDVAVGASAPRTVGSAWPFRAQKTVRLTNRFRWREIQDQPFSSGSPSASVDDRDEALSYAERIRDSQEQCTGHGSIVLRYLTRSYVIGDGIAGTAGRSVNLRVDGSGEHASWPVVVAVTWDFEQGTNKTELLLDSPRLRVTK